MNDNRRQILDMLAQGKINSDEAERLIAALERSDLPTAARHRQCQISACAGRCQ